MKKYIFLFVVLVNINSMAMGQGWTPPGGGCDPDDPDYEICEGGDEEVPLDTHVGLLVIGGALFGLAKLAFTKSRNAQVSNNKPG